jgi:hypothetical protein
MKSTNPQRWARVRPGLAWKRPWLPTEWVRVLELHPDDAKTLPGDVWLDMPVKVRPIAAHRLEYRDEPPASDG